MTLDFFVIQKKVPTTFMFNFLSKYLRSVSTLLNVQHVKVHGILIHIKAQHSTNHHEICSPEHHQESLIHTTPIHAQIADNTFKFELLFKRIFQPKITLTSTDIILHLLTQSPVLFKSPPFLLINYTLTSTNIILHLIFHISGVFSLPLPPICNPHVQFYLLPNIIIPT